MPKKNNKVAHSFGKFFAIVQDSIDCFAAWGFKQLKKASDSKPKQKEGKFFTFAKKTGEFIGEMGGAFYKEYERLKQKRKK